MLSIEGLQGLNALQTLDITGCSNKLTDEVSKGKFKFEVIK